MASVEHRSIVRKMLYERTTVIEECHTSIPVYTLSDKGWVDTVYGFNVGA